MGSGRFLIAVVDDEEPVRIALRRLLRSAGLDVETFSSGAEFIESLQVRNPDCVVLDLQMPKVDGFAVQRRLAAAESRPPVVVITGHDSEEAREQALSNGASSYHRKPVDGDRLLGAIAAAIAGARAAEHGSGNDGASRKFPVTPRAPMGPGCKEPGGSNPLGL